MCTRHIILSLLCKMQVPIKTLAIIITLVHIHYGAAISQARLAVV